MMVKRIWRKTCRFLRSLVVLLRRMPHQTWNRFADSRRDSWKTHSRNVNYYECSPPRNYFPGFPSWCYENNITIGRSSLIGEGESTFNPWSYIIVPADKREVENVRYMDEIFSISQSKTSGSYGAFQVAVRSVENDASLRVFTNKIMTDFVGTYTAEDLKTNGLHRGSLEAHIRTFCVNAHHVLNAIASNTHTKYGIKLANENHRFWLRNYVYGSFIGMDGEDLGSLYRRFYVGAYVHDMLKPLIPGRNAGHEEAVFKYMMGEEKPEWSLIPWETLVGDFQLNGYDKFAVACYSRYMGRFCDEVKTPEGLCNFYEELCELARDPKWGLSQFDEDVFAMVRKLFWELVLFNALDVASGCVVQGYADTPDYLRHKSDTQRTGVMHLHLYAWCSNSSMYRMFHDVMDKL